jgi:hypothetical protein
MSNRKRQASPTYSPIFEDGELSECSENITGSNNELRAAVGAAGGGKAPVKNTTEKQSSVRLPKTDDAFKEYKTKVIEKLQAMTVHLHQPVTGLEGVEPPYVSTLQPDIYIPQPAIVINIDVTNRNALVAAFKYKLMLLKGAQGKRDIFPYIGDKITDIGGNVVKINNEELRWPKTILFFLSQGIDGKEFAENMGYLWSAIKESEPDNNGTITRWILELQLKPFEFTYTDAAFNTNDKNIKLLNQQIEAMRTTISQTSCFTEVSSSNTFKTYLYGKVLASGIGFNASEGVNLFYEIHSYVCKIFDFPLLSQDKIIDIETTTINAMILSVSISILILFVPTQSIPLGQILNSLKPYFGSVVAIGLSETISGLIGGFFDKGIMPVVSSTEEIVRNTAQHLLDLKKNFQDLKKEIQDLFFEFYLDAGDEDFPEEDITTTMEDVYNLSHEYDRIDKATEMILEDAQEQSQEDAMNLTAALGIPFERGLRRVDYAEAKDPFYYNSDGKEEKPNNRGRDLDKLDPDQIRDRSRSRDRNRYDADAKPDRTALPGDKFYKQGRRYDVDGDKLGGRDYQDKPGGRYGGGSKKRKSKKIKKSKKRGTRKQKKSSRRSKR